MWLTVGPIKRTNEEEKKKEDINAQRNTRRFASELSSTWPRSFCSFHLLDVRPTDRSTHGVWSKETNSRHSNSFNRFLWFSSFEYRFSLSRSWNCRNNSKSTKSFCYRNDCHWRCDSHFDDFSDLRDLVKMWHVNSFFSSHRTFVLFRFDNSAILLVSGVVLIFVFILTLVFGILRIVKNAPTRDENAQFDVSVIEPIVQLSIELVATLFAILATFVLVRYIKAKYLAVSTRIK